MLLMGFMLLTGCSASAGPAGPIVDVESARARWVTQSMQNYSYDFQRMCFCVEEAREPVTVQVRNGAVTGVTSRTTGISMLQTENLTWYTMEELLDMIAEAQRDGQEVVVDYDSRGYPMIIEIGSLAADAGVRYEIANVTRVD